MLCRTARHYHWGTAGGVTTRLSLPLAGRTLHDSPSISSPSSTILGLGDSWCCHNTPIPFRPSNIAQQSKISSLKSTTIRLGDNCCYYHMFIILLNSHGSTSHCNLRLALCRALHLDWGDRRNIISRFYKAFFFNFVLLSLFLLFYMKRIRHHKDCKSLNWKANKM